MIKALSALLPFVGKALDKVVPDAGMRDQLKHEITTQLITANESELKAAASVLTAEITGESWLQRNWRPITMLTFVGLVVAHWLGYTAENLTEEQTLALLGIVKTGLGGYVLGRSAEKAVKAYKSR